MRQARACGWNENSPRTFVIRSRPCRTRWVASADRFIASPGKIVAEIGVSHKMGEMDEAELADTSDLPSVG